MGRRWLCRKMLCRDARLNRLEDSLSAFLRTPVSPEERCCRVSGEGLEGEFRRAFLDNFMEVSWEDARSDRETRLTMSTTRDAYILYFSLFGELFFIKTFSSFLLYIRKPFSTISFR